MRQWPLRTSIFAFAVALATGCGGGGGGGSSGSGSGTPSNGNGLHGPELTERVVEHNVFQPGTAFINIELDYLRLIPRDTASLHYMLVLDGQLAVYNAKETDVEVTTYEFSPNDPVRSTPLGYGQDDEHFYFTDNPGSGNSVALYRLSPGSEEPKEFHIPDNARVDQGLVPVFVSAGHVAIAYINNNDRIEIRSMSKSGPVPGDCPNGSCQVINSDGDVGFLSNPLLQVGPNNELFYERYALDRVDALATKMDGSAEFRADFAFWVGFTNPSSRYPVPRDPADDTFIDNTGNNLLFQESIKEIEETDPTGVEDVDGDATHRWDLKPAPGVYGLFAAEFDDDDIADGFSNQRVGAVIYSKEDSDGIYVATPDNGSWTSEGSISGFGQGDRVCEVMGAPNLDDSDNYESSSVLLGLHDVNDDSCSDVENRLELDWVRVQLGGTSHEPFPGVPLAPLFDDDGAAAGWLSLDDNELFKVSISDLSPESLDETGIDQAAFLRAVNSGVSSYARLAGRAIFVQSDANPRLASLESPVGGTELFSITTDISTPPTEYDHGILDSDLESIDFFTGYGQSRLGHTVTGTDVNGTLYAEPVAGGSTENVRISDSEDNIPVPLF